MFVHLKLFISLKTVCENSGILVLEIVEEDKEVKMLTFLLWKYFLDFQHSVFSSQLSQESEFMTTYQLF